MFKFSHNSINIFDLNRSLKFYKEALNLEEVGRIDLGDMILVLIGDKVTSQYLELTYIRNRNTPYNLGDNKFHFAIIADDMNFAHDLHKKMNCICNEIEDLGIYFINDPDGYIIEIIPNDFYDRHLS